MNVQAGSRWTIKRPTFPVVFGQGAPLDYVLVTVDGRAYRFPHDQEVQASAQCDPTHKVANLEGSPPLVRTTFIEQNPDMFEFLSDQ